MEIGEIVHGLWIGTYLSPLELLCLKSFQRFGYSFKLWHYEKIENCPENVILCDANEIIPSHEVFRYENRNKFGHGKGSYAGFSDIFRYKLLYIHGGWWTDMDITCLKPATNFGDYIFRHHHKVGAVGNIMFCPPNSPIMKYCYEEAKKLVDAHNQDWMLPVKILNKGIKKFHLEKYILSCSNIDSFPVVLPYLNYYKEMQEEWCYFHWMNEEFRRMNIDKDSFPEKSTIGILLSDFQIPYQKIPLHKLFKNRLSHSRIHYLIKNIRSTILWYLK